LQNVKEQPPLRTPERLSFSFQLLVRHSFSDGGRLFLILPRLDGNLSGDIQENVSFFAVVIFQPGTAF